MTRVLASWILKLLPWIFVVAVGNGVFVIKLLVSQVRVLVRKSAGVVLVTLLAVSGNPRGVL